MSETPETDHLEDQLGSAAKFSHPVIWRHARQLERERNEARKAIREAWLAMDEIDGTDRMVKWQGKHASILEGAK
jgi:hypothetical protein